MKKKDKKNKISRNWYHKSSQGPTRLSPNDKIPLFDLRYRHGDIDFLQKGKENDSSNSRNE